MLKTVCFAILVLQVALAWEDLPQLPSGRRSQYYLLNDDGGYKYGFDTGSKYFAKQSADPNNEVEGHYIYPVDGQLVDVRYKSGVDGFQIQNANLPAPKAGSAQSLKVLALNSYLPPQADSWSLKSSESSESSGPSDASYSFSYNAGDSARDESADASGNIKGRYSYTNDAGTHDLTYVAGSETGFLVTGGSLSAPSAQNNLAKTQHAASSGSWAATKTSASAAAIDSNAGSDGSYSFSYNTGDSSRQESADAAGNVRGKYAYSDEAGNHDLSYTAGSDTGFIVTGGSLATPNAQGYAAKTQSSGSWVTKSSAPATYAAPAAVESAGAGDGSYSFSYNTGDSSRQESADAAGNVRGKYAYTDEAGSHDLSYTAGADTGFLVTGGSLANPNAEGYAAKTQASGSWATKSSAPATYSAPAAIESAGAGDGSYSFSYNTGDSSRQESADAAGNVRGKYAYSDEAGNHDLSYTAGSDTGFVVTGGSLATPNAQGYAAKTQSSGSWATKSNAPATYTVPAAIESAGAGDGSYSFSYNTGDSSRQESADAAGNVRGKYAYTDEAGSHDLSYTAGADTGFLVTGGSLAAPNAEGYAAKTQSSGSWATKSSAPATYAAPAAIESAGAGDGSYSFSYNTGDHSRQESADASGNVRGAYSYSDEAGQHDLSYSAGSDTGFIVTGGSLATPNAEGYAAKTQSSSSDSWATKSSAPVAPAAIESAGAGDGSYSFSYNTGDAMRQESADASGNVRGAYSYSDEAGNHDLSYIAGADTGFVVTGGSLATPNAEGYAAKAQSASSGSWSSKTASVESDESPSDGSYTFSYNAGNSERQESADSAGNVKGRYSYTDDAGQHDLSYKAGSDTGFIVTGGSLATPNVEGYAAKASPVANSGSWATKSSAPAAPVASWISKSSEPASGSSDGSYMFSYNDGNSERHESADASGNVKGRYSYTNDAGSHDLHYTAGSDTGFKVTGGSLASPNGLEAGLKSAKSGSTSSSSSWSTKSSSNQKSSSSSSPSKITYTLPSGVSKLRSAGPDTLVIKYLPVQENPKYGYIYDSQ